MDPCLVYRDIKNSVTLLILNTNLTIYQCFRHAMWIYNKFSFFFSPEIDFDLPICNRSQNFFVLNSSTSILQNFSSPNYPADYPTYSYCIWVLTAPIGKLVKLTFSAFSIYAPTASNSRRCPYAYVKVTEQDTQGQSQVVGSFCGSQSPQTIYSSGGSLRVEFKNTFRTSAKGFVAKYSAIQPGMFFIKYYNIEYFKCQWV
jgi:hypothetical protein